MLSLSGVGHGFLSHTHTLSLSLLTTVLSSLCSQEDHAARLKEISKQLQYAQRRYTNEVKHAVNPDFAFSFDKYAKNLQAVSMVTRRLLDSTDMDLLYSGRMLCLTFRQHKVPKRNRLRPTLILGSGQGVETVPHSAGAWQD